MKYQGEPLPPELRDVMFEGLDTLKPALIKLATEGELSNHVVVIVGDYTGWAAFVSAQDTCVERFKAAGANEEFVAGIEAGPCAGSFLVVLLKREGDGQAMWSSNVSTEQLGVPTLGSKEAN